MRAQIAAISKLRTTVAEITDMFQNMCVMVASDEG